MGNVESNIYLNKGLQENINQDHTIYGAQVNLSLYKICTATDLPDVFLKSLIIPQPY
jgi:hypothetical protein